MPVLWTSDTAAVSEMGFPKGPSPGKSESSDRDAKPLSFSSMLLALLRSVPWLLALKLLMGCSHVPGVWLQPESWHRMFREGKNPLPKFPNIISFQISQIISFETFEDQ